MRSGTTLVLRSFAKETINSCSTRRIGRTSNVYSRRPECKGEKPLRGVLHLWSLDFPLFDTMTNRDLARSQLLGCGAALHLCPGARFTQVRFAALCLARNARSAGGAKFIGSGQRSDGIVVRPGARDRCRTSRTALPDVDLDQPRPDDDGDVLFGELARGNFGEDTIAFRNQSRLVPRLARLP